MVDDGYGCYRGLYTLLAVSVIFRFLRLYRDVVWYLPFLHGHTIPDNYP